VDIVAVTKRLTPEMALEAYPQGLFPMYSPEIRAVTWHRPRKRAILPIERIHVPRRLERTMRRGGFEVTFDRDFGAVMRGCAAGRPVWIGREFFDVYGELHRRGFAHSVEVWRTGDVGGQLEGGTYGVQIGAAFFAESKFHRARDASKVALVALARRLRSLEFALLEVQYATPHLRQFGVIEVSHREYAARLADAVAQPREFARAA
jgi:leucyl/phenylalanyl-tRNA--protein transferase